MIRNWSAALRAELARRAADIGVSSGLPHYRSKGRNPTVLFEPTTGGRHGNFHDSSYRAAKSNAKWARRLEKPHPQAATALPADHAEACELDSSNSSDALLVNCFCYPGAATRIFESLLPGWPVGEPDLGVRGSVPLANGGVDQTEIDMRAGKVLFEAKLTETDFTTKSKAYVATYRDFGKVFDPDMLPAKGNDFEGYQPIRNVLAAADQDGYFVLLCDGRRPDLLHTWWTVHAAIRSSGLRARCTFLLWQEVAAVCTPSMQTFLAAKYGL
jgi:hypothetical protein